MAASSDEKTEPATPRRRREARQGGQVARSQDLTAAVLLLTGFLTLAMLGPGIWQGLIALLCASLTLEGPIVADDVVPFASAAAVDAFKRLAPFLLALFVAMLITLLLQIGFLFSWKPVTPNLKKINPIAGFKRLFSIRSIMLAVTNFGKLIVVGVVGYFTLVGSAAAILYAFSFEHADIFKIGSSLMFALSMKLGVALLILALLDFAWQRYKHERDLRMTKEEVKDEFRSMEGDQQIKRKRRDVQLKLAMQRLHQDVPKADVVVTNPTHVAVAIAYDPETMAAPKVVAKGADYIALRIRQIATQVGIPTVERPPLARTLFETVEVGQYIPEKLYKAIAEILAYVYELTGRSLRRNKGKLAHVQ